MKHFEANIIEDNGGGLAMFVFDEGGIDGGKIIWSHSGYEYHAGDLSGNDIPGLLKGDDPRSGWDGCDEDPQGNYDGYDKYEYGWEVVAQVFGGKLHLHKNVMGRAARIEFGIEND